MLLREQQRRSSCSCLPRQLQLLSRLLPHPYLYPFPFKVGARQHARASIALCLPVPSAPAPKAPVFLTVLYFLARILLFVATLLRPRSTTPPLFFIFLRVIPGEILKRETPSD
jgi:hypothetical protein